MPTSSHRPADETVTTDEIVAVLDRHQRELGEIIRRYRVSATARPPLPLWEPTEPIEPPLQRDQAQLRLDELRRERFGRSA